MTIEDVERAIDVCINVGTKDMKFVADIIYSQQARIDTLQNLLTKWQVDYEELDKQFMDCIDEGK